MRIKLLFLQCLLCLFAILSYVTVKECIDERTLAAGSFDGNVFFNDTFEDLSHNLYREFFND